MGDNRVQTASGSGLKEEGKFRQRVENHYKIMADARSSLKTHSKLQMAAALGLVTVVGMGVALEEADALEGLIAGSAGLVLGIASRSGNQAATGMKPELHAAAAAAYSDQCKASMLLLVFLMSVVGFGASQAIEVQPVSYVYGALALIALPASALGARAAASILYAFSLQAARRGAKEEPAEKPPPAAAPPSRPTARKGKR